MRQGIDDFEIVISDNASEDDTEEIVRALANPHVRYFRNETNLGPHENGRLCVTRACGEFVKPLCADDVLLDGVLRKQLDILRHRPAVALVTCDLFITDSDLNIERRLRFFPGACSGNRVINACLSGLVNYVGGPSNIMYRRADYEYLPVDETYRSLADLKFNLHLLMRGDYVNIDQPGYLYRRHTNSDSEMSVTEQISRSESIRLLEEFNWWNPFNCIKVLRLIGIDGLSVTCKHLAQILKPSGIGRAIAATPDVLRMYIRNTRDYKAGTRIGKSHMTAKKELTGKA